MTSTKKLLQPVLTATFILAVIAATFGSAGIIHAQPVDATCAQTYTVKSGDNLTKIAAAYNITWTELANANNLKYPYTIYVGAKLCIPAAGSGASPTPIPESSSSNFTATVKGDELTITLKNFPKNTGFFVRVRPSTGSFNYEKIGVLYTNNNGEGKVTLTLTTNALKNAATLSVCVKNINNSKLDCTTSTKTAATPSTTKSGTFTATLVGKSLTIKGSDFSNNTFFFVRVNKAQNKYSGTWEKVGIVKSNGSGVINQTIQLTNEYSGATILHICLKNTNNDALTCRTIYP